MEAYLNKGIKEIIDQYPDVEKILNEYGSFEPSGSRARYPFPSWKDDSRTCPQTRKRN